MKTFESDNHYDVLQIPPGATREEIRHAYQQASALYDSKSVATYALFSDAQRQALLWAIDEAFETLIDDDRRIAYNQMLIDTGVLDATAFDNHVRQEPRVRPDTGGPFKEESLCRWAASRAREPEMHQRIDAILSGPQLSGPQLKELRKAYGIDLSEIYATTRISKDVMTAIEADRIEDLPAMVYLKPFLKSLSRILQIDPSQVVERYLNTVGLSRPGR